MASQLRAVGRPNTVSGTILAIGVSLLWSLSCIGCSEPSGGGLASQGAGAVQSDDNAVRVVKGQIDAYLSECEVIANMFGGSGSQSSILSQKSVCETALSRIAGLQTDARLSRIRTESDLISLTISTAIAIHDIGVQGRRSAAKVARSIDDIRRESEAAAKKEYEQRVDVASEIRKRVGTIRQCMDTL